MKRNLFIYVLLIILASCSNNIIDETQSLIETREPIKFSALYYKMNTRYANENKNNYHMYGFIEGENDKGWFINSEMASGVDGSATDVVSNGGYFWPGNQKNVQIYAFAPDTTTLGLNSVTVDSSTPSIKIQYQVNDSAQGDFTIAIPILQNSGAVTFQFQHLLSKIVVNLGLSSELSDAGYSLGDYTTTILVPFDINTIDAVYDYSDTNKLPAWGSSPTSTSSDSTIYYEGFNSYLIMPQTFTPTSTNTSNNSTIWGNCVVKIRDLKISLTVNGEHSLVFKGDLEQYGFYDDVIANNTFQPNTCYNLNFTITDIAKDNGNNSIFNGAVTFNPTVADWTVDDTDLD